MSLKSNFKNYCQVKNLKWLLVALSFFIFALGFAFAYSLGSLKGNEFNAEEITIKPFEGSEVTDRASARNEEGQMRPAQEEWVLYVTGAVNNPGVYRLPQDSRVYQLVEKAGGLTPKADSAAVNLAAKLNDGCHVHVPEVGETVSVGREVSNVPVSQGYSAHVVYTGSQKTTVDLNDADIGTLQNLPGIGPKTAQAIVDYREAKGGFRSVEELLDVKGIGPKKMEKIRPFVTVGYR